MQEKYIYWLMQVPGLGARGLAQLLSVPGGAEAVYRMGEDTLLSLGVSVKTEVKEKIIAHRKEFPIEREYEQFLKKNIQMTWLGNASYPKRLRYIPDPPAVLFFKGQLPPEDKVHVAVVGARECSEYGSYVARELGIQLAAADMVLVSGFGGGIGCGGAGSALATCACYEGAAELKVADLRAESVKNLVDKLTALTTTGELAGGTKVSGLAVLDGTASDEQKAIWGAAAKAADLVVNATPMGLHPGEPSALPPSCFHAGQFVLDIVPTKEFPPTATAAVKAGATATDGLEFLVGQGAKSFEIWTGVTADRKAMLAAIRA